MMSGFSLVKVALFFFLTKIRPKDLNFSLFDEIIVTLKGNEILKSFGISNLT